MANATNGAAPAAVMRAAPDRAVPAPKGAAPCGLLSAKPPPILGTALDAAHTVRQFEAAGIAAVCFEDKVVPNLNSFPGRQLLEPVGDFGCCLLKHWLPIPAPVCHRRPSSQLLHAVLDELCRSPRTRVQYVGAGMQGSGPSPLNPGRLHTETVCEYLTGSGHLTTLATSAGRLLTEVAP